MPQPIRSITWLTIAGQFFTAFVSTDFAVESLTESKVSLFGASLTRDASPIAYWLAVAFFATVGILALGTAILLYRQRRRTSRAIIASPGATSGDSPHWRSRTP